MVCCFLGFPVAVGKLLQLSRFANKICRKQEKWKMLRCLAKAVVGIRVADGVTLSLIREK